MDSCMEALSVLGSLIAKDFVQMVLILCVGLLSINLIVYLVWERRRKIFRHVEAFPGPRRYPLLGSIPELITNMRKPTRDVLPWLKKCSESYGKVYKIWIPFKPAIVVNCADTASYLLKGDLISAKTKEANRVGKIIGADGLASIEPAKHSLRRKMWSPHFTRKRVENAIATFRQEVLKLCQKLEQYCPSKDGDSREFDFYQLALKCTFQTICYEAFGSEYMKNLPEKRGDEHNQCLHTIEKNLITRFFQPWLKNEFVYFNVTQIGRKTKKCIEIGNSVAQEAIQFQKNIRAKRECTFTPNEKFKRDESSVTCFLDNLLDLEEQGNLSELEVLHELNTFIAGGYETSGLTLCYVIYLLSLHPEYQDKVVSELCDIIGRKKLERFDASNYEVTPADIKEMKFMELCVKETLRMYPIIPVLIRRATSDVTLLDGKIIPEGVDVFVNILGIQNDPKLFPEPEKFKPERHLNPNPGWIPFSLGSRNCIGQVFGMYEVKVMLAYLLLHYKFETVEKPGLVPIYQFVYIPEQGIRVKINRRIIPELSNI